MLRKFLIIAGALCFSAAAQAQELTWTDWTSSTPTTATGTLGSITVDFTGEQSPSSQTNGGINYWAPNSGIYTPTGSENPPPDSDIIRLTQARGEIMFSAPVVDPIMAILSVGRTNLPVTYEFDAGFEILNQGSGYWGGSDTALTDLGGNVLEGREGHGLIQFNGTFDSISFETSSEYWHGFQVGYVNADQIDGEVPVPAGIWFLLSGLAAFGYLRSRKA